MKRIVTREGGDTQADITEIYTPTSAVDARLYLGGMAVLVLCGCMMIYGCILLFNWMAAVANPAGALDYVAAHIAARPVQYGVGLVGLAVVFGFIGFKMIGRS